MTPRPQRYARCPSRTRPGGLALHRPEGLRPGRFGGTDSTRVRPWTMLDIDVAGLGSVSEAGSRSSARPTGSRFEPLAEHERLGTLVGADDKFTAHNAASWTHGLLVHVPKGVELEQPLYVRIANSSRGRLALLAAARRRRGGRALLADRGVRVRVARARGYSNAAVELFVEQGAKLEYVSLQNLSRETWHFATHHARVERDAELDWVAGGFGSKKGKIRIQNDLAGQGATSRVTGAYFADGDAAPRLRHVPGAHRAEHDLGLRVQGRAARRGDDGLARDDPRRAATRRRRTPTRRTATCCSPRTRTPTRSPASRSSPTTSAAPTARRSARSTASSSST